MVNTRDAMPDGGTVTISAPDAMLVEKIEAAQIALDGPDRVEARRGPDARYPFR